MLELAQHARLLSKDRTKVAIDLLAKRNDPDAKATDFSSDENLLLASIQGRCLIATADDSLGLAPAATLPHDHVALIAGLPVPCILRQEGSNFRYIGSAVVNGMMFGEAWPEDESELREITLV
jgi:hypothetical protein